MNVFGYPLRNNHYGTCEQALGEAMAAEVVPVVMGNPAERLIVGDGLNVVKDEEEYVEAITQLYHLPGIRAELAFAAKERAKELYNIDNTVKEWNEVFQFMMQQPKKERKVLKIS